VRDALRSAAIGKKIASIELDERTEVPDLNFEELTLQFDDGTRLVLRAEEFVPQR
jgi:hypothetical protein